MTTESFPATEAKQPRSLPQKICIVTTRHVSYNPRVLKEADALHAAGCDVVVVTINNHAQQRRDDELLMQNRSWKLKTVNFRREVPAEKKTWLLFSLKQRFYSALNRLTFSFGFAERAAEKAYDGLLRLSLEERADLYIIHHPEALGIGAAAARKWGVPFAFDAEDFHSGMREGGATTREEDRIRFLEKKYLPACAYVSAASKGIAQAYASLYGILEPKLVLNVFPKAGLPSFLPTNPVRFYWYSQVIGPHRNLEDLVTAASQINLPFEVHLRGSWHSAGYESFLKEKLAALSLTKKFFFHAPILAEELIPDASQYDVGLALESDVSQNRNICVTNKTFAYLMAGLALVGTDTEGQKDIFQHFAGAAWLCRMNDPESLAAAMRFLIQNPEALSSAKQKARNYALHRFNWEDESQRFLSLVASVQTQTEAPVQGKT